MATPIEIDKIFQQYLADISLTMINDKSSYTKQNKAIEEQFLRYGLTNEQVAGIIAEINGKAMQFITQYSNASALELVKLNENRPLLEAQIALANKELELKDKDLELKEADLKLKEKELELKDKELDLKDKELEIKIEQLAQMKIDGEIKLQELEIKKQELEIAKEKLMLTRAQTETEKKKPAKLVADTALVNAQVGIAGVDKLIKTQQKLTEVQKTELTKQQGLESQKKQCLIAAQCTSEAKQQALLGSQKSLVDRQKTGYDDNRRVKKSEHLGNMAGFAVNSGADGASGMVSAATTAANQI